MSDMFMDLHVRVNHIKYPPYHNGRYMEEFFFDYWNQTDFQGKDKLCYIDIFWHNAFLTYGRDNVIAYVKPIVIARCKEAQERGQIPFTVCKWDDGIGFGADKPHNLVVFSVGQSKDVPLPLIVENTPTFFASKCTFKETPSLLCSFVGTITHDVRRKMMMELQGHPQIEIHCQHSWTIDVPQHLLDLFINVTKRSRFGLAPRGYGYSSFRFFEIIHMGVIPVFIHDGEDELPFQDVIDYSKFSVSMHINDIHTLPDVLSRIDDAAYATMLQNLEDVKPKFTPEWTSQYIIDKLEKKGASIV